MLDMITIGETLVAFAPTENIRLRYANGFRMRVAGAESNTAIALQKLGRSTGWISRVGDDEFGAYILAMVRAEGVDTSRVLVDPTHRTGVLFKQPLPGNETEVAYYRDNSAASTLSPQDIDESSIAGAKLLHITGITPALSNSCLATIRYAVEVARKHNIPISFDPNIRRKLWQKEEFVPILLELVAQSNILLLGLDEAQALFGTGEIDQIFDTVFSYPGISHLAVKNGGVGSYVGSGRQYTHIAPYTCHCIDPVGAGDGFNAGFLFGLLEGMSAVDCGKIGNIVGALATETKGDIEGYPSRAVLDRLLASKQKIYR